MTERAVQRQRRKAARPAKNTHRGNSRRVFTYLLRYTNRDLWNSVKVKAMQEQRPVNHIIEYLLTEWVGSPTR